ncbi:threonine-rich protein-like [Actinia tenebrosa]|uniref:Threonine-rich protein-like n=1 Tax=Actinia tenebrosa TaxID=6105 RepID=A0A6P8J414_ACTTE|nr:threonine-rich protein-like [Actinia tenebrosa]
MDGSWRYGLVFLVVLSLFLFLTDQTSAIRYAGEPVECDAMELEKVGCFTDDQQVPRPLPKMLFTNVNETSPYFSGVKVNEPDPDSYMINLICICAQEALYKGYNMFGLQHYGECWSGRNIITFQNFNRNGPSTHCITWKGKPCKKGLDCIGEDNTNFVYKVKDKPLPTSSATSTAKSTGSPTQPSSKPLTTKKIAKPTKNVPFHTPSGAATSTPKSTGSPTKPSSKPSTTTAKPAKSFPPPSPSGSGTSTAKSTGSPTKPSSKPSTTTAKPAKRFPSPSPSGSGTSTAKSTGSQTKPSSRPSATTAKPAKSFPFHFPSGSSIPYVPIPYQMPSYQVPQSITYPTCPVFSCPTTCYPACTIACCRSKLTRKTKAKSHHKRAVLANLNEAQGF